MKKKFAPLLSILVVIAVLALSLTAFGSDTDYIYDANTKTLYIVGTGDMDNYEDAYSSPWHDVILSVKNVVVEDGVTSVGDYAFAGAASLSNVTLADSVTSIGANSFFNCKSLTSLTLGDNVLTVSDESFAYYNLEPKSDFAVTCNIGSYALYYCLNHNINVDCPSVTCGTYGAYIAKGSMMAVYPYTAKVSGTFKFYSVGNYDTKGFLYDSSMTQLKYDDESGASSNFSITYDLTKGETYYFAARLFSNKLVGKFNVVIEPVSYSVSGTICAMQNKNGEPSDMILTNALIDGEQTNGQFECTVNGSKTVTITADNVEKTYTFSPDDGDNVTISLMMCDVNGDGIVNAKDYAIMKKSNSDYIKFFKNFVNYRT